MVWTFNFSVQMVICLYLVPVFPCPTGTYHQGEVCTASLVTTALTVSTVEAASLSHQCSKYLLLAFTCVVLESKTIWDQLIANIALYCSSHFCERRRSNIKTNRNRKNRKDKDNCVMSCDLLYSWSVWPNRKYRTSVDTCVSGHEIGFKCHVKCRNDKWLKLTYWMPF